MYIWSPILVVAGRDIDAIARSPLWRAGLDYRHGTGHGLGAYLNVHEGEHIKNMTKQKDSIGTYWMHCTIF